MKTKKKKEKMIFTSVQQFRFFVNEKEKNKSFSLANNMFYLLMKADEINFQLN